MAKTFNEFFASIVKNLGILLELSWNKLSKYQCGLRKEFGTQDCLWVMIDKLRKIRDNRGVFATVFTDLWQAFDCISHELTAKLNAYGSGIKPLNFILAYFTNRKQKTKKSSSFSEFLNIFFGVPQGSILGPLLFIIYICDIFMDMTQ